MFARAALCGCLLWGGMACAREVSQCDAALVKAISTNSSSNSVDWRLATEVDQGTWEDAQKKFGMAAEIYGFPIGGSYQDFHNRVTQTSEKLNTSFSQDTRRNMLWVGLDPGSLPAYEACLNTVVLLAPGLHMVVDHVTSTDITLRLKYNPGGYDPPTIPISWVGVTSRVDNGPLPESVAAGSPTFVVIARPNFEKTVAINSPKNGGGSLVIEPLPSVPPPPPVTIYSARMWVTPLPGRFPVPADKDVTSVVASYCQNASATGCSFTYEILNEDAATFGTPYWGQPNHLDIYYGCGLKRQPVKKVFELKNPTDVSLSCQ